MRPKLEILRGRLDGLLGTRRPVIVMYHNIAKVDCDPWDLSVDPANFREQILALASEREIVPLAALAKAAARRRSKKPLAAVTFDDGYRSVLTVAEPILAALGCPGTVFLTTGAIGTEREYWWDDLTRIVLGCREAVLGFACGGRRHAFAIAREPAGRRKQLEDMADLLATVPAQERSDALHEMAASAGAGDLSPRTTHAVLRREDVDALKKGGTIAIGAHGVSHRRLAAMQATEQAAEILGSRDDCASLTGARPTCFAYPHGSYDVAAVAAVRSAGFAAAVTTNFGAIGKHSDPLLLPRVAMTNRGGQAMLRALP
jgi:peptidoglycan/xylan/chitin deacetylase (PgdA/CDA1 family)